MWPSHSYWQAQYSDSTSTSETLVKSDWNCAYYLRLSCKLWVYQKKNADYSVIYRKSCNFAAVEHINRKDMEQARTPLNAAQMEFLQLLGRIKTEEELSELRKVVCDYYARKIDEEMDRLWAEGK